jgi:Rod binding domain-containing protein
MSNHKTYRDLYKHQASVLMQARTGCVGMADLLFKRRVPDVPSPLCSCGAAPETPEHVLLHCGDTAVDREMIRQRVALPHCVHAAT